MTLATVGGGDPYCANLFYVWMAEENLFVFTSDRETKHAVQMNVHSKVAASVVLETRSVGKVRGLQITGKVMPAEGEIASRARKAYLLRFPYAIAAKLTLWVLSPDMMKFTDNRLGFGKKLIWRVDFSA